MRRWTSCLLCLLVLSAAVPAFALTPGTDVLVPAAARVATWITDLYVMNPGDTSVNVTVYWLVRNQANPNPISISLVLQPGETAVLEDLIESEFGLSEGAGAFRVVATGSVVVNSRIYSLQGGVTFGQGFEGVPASMATTTSTDIVGLAKTAAFRSNFYGLAGANGATLQASLRDADDVVIANKNYTLGAYQPMLVNVTDFAAGLADFEYGTVHVNVTSGSAVVGASKADNDPATGDPTTLESWTPEGAGGSADGTYQFAIYDSLDYAAGGNLVIEGGEVTEINGTYMNWDKLDGGDPACTLIFLWGGAMSPAIDVDDFATGVVLENTYPDSGEMTWTFQFEVVENIGLTGTLAATGADFTGDQSGCNGSFPTLDFEGGKSD